MIKKILSFKTKDGVALDSDTKLWIVSTIAGSIVVDKKVHPSEKIHVEVLFEEIKDEPRALITMHEIIKGEAPLRVKPISLPYKLAEQIFKYILDIAACDNELPPEEIRYLNEVGLALGIDVLKVHKLIHFTIRTVKVEFFNQLLGGLNKDERQWLAFVILKAIYLDGRIDKGEIIYLNHVFELLDGEESLIDQWKRDVKTKNLSDFPLPKFDFELSTRILKYLLGITMTHTDVDNEEIGFVKEIAESLEYDQEQLAQLIASEYKILLFLAISGRL